MKNISASILISLSIVGILGPFIIPFLRKIKLGQTIRNEGPKTHLSKNGTPTMGGIMIIFSVLLTTLILGEIKFETILLLLSTLGFGVIGFLDDYIKVVKKRSLGLKASEKIFLQLFLSITISISLYYFAPDMTNLIIPFTNIHINIGYLYVPFIVFVILGTVNAVNLTDGLDGLASSITAIVSLFFIIISIILSKLNIGIFSASVLGACLGFLIFNKYPAKIFMGDTGSMALGGAVVSMALITNLTLFIPIIGGIYFIEALSVIIQVLSYKTRKKRVFKMAPLHHHFEQCGLSEIKVVGLFLMISVILFILSIVSITKQII